MTTQSDDSFDKNNEPKDWGKFYAYELIGYAALLIPENINTDMKFVEHPIYIISASKYGHIIYKQSETINIKWFACKQEWTRMPDEECKIMKLSWYNEMMQNRKKSTEKMPEKDCVLTDLLIELEILLGTIHFSSVAKKINDNYGCNIYFLYNGAKWKAFLERELVSEIKSIKGWRNNFLHLTSRMYVGHDPKDFPGIFIVKGDVESKYWILQFEHKN